MGKQLAPFNKYFPNSLERRPDGHCNSLKIKGDFIPPFGIQFAPMFRCKRSTMDFLQGMPEAGQMVLMGSALLFVGVLLRKLRKVFSIFREPAPSPHHSELR
jgi:hypothetical protein